VAKQTNAEVTHRITLRHRSITAKHRLSHGSRTFDINSIRDIEERGVELEILCK
jgi:SPP1 family predicted phage head-tail adaptor